MVDISMETKKIAIVVLYDENSKILLQGRAGISKFGEEWGYFGGKIEKGETPRVAVKREVKEELDFNLTRFSYLGRYELIGKSLATDKDRRLVQAVFIAKISRIEFKSMVLHEGSDIRWFSIKQAKKLKMHPLEPKILEDTEKFIKEKQS